MVAIWNIWKTSVVNSNASLDNEIVNQFSRATNVFGNWILVMEKPRDRSENKAIVITLLYSSEAWIPYRNQIEQIHVFHKRCIRTICDLFWRTGYQMQTCFCVSVSESFLIQSQLRWANRCSQQHSWIPTSLVYHHLDCGKRNVECPWLRYKDKLNANRAALQDI